MTFQANIPNATDLISVSQTDILQNFQALDTSWNVNHVDFNDAGDGKHKFVEMPNQVTPGPAGAGSQFAIYSLDDSGQSEIWYRRNAEGTPYQLTGPNPVIGAAATFKSSTFLPGGLILKYGLVASPSDGLAVTFDAAFPNAVFILTMGISRNGTSTSSTYYTSLAVGGFTIRTSSGSNDALTYIAIGN